MILIINTSEQEKSTVALSSANLVIIEKSWPSKHHQSEKLLPAIDKLFKKSKLKLQDLQAIIAVNGPGPFSAVRTGVCLANILAYALKIPVASVKLTEFKNSDELVKVGESKLQKIKHQNIIKPFYGKKPNITKQVVE